MTGLNALLSLEALGGDKTISTAFATLTDSLHLSAQRATVLCLPQHACEVAGWPSPERVSLAIGGRDRSQPIWFARQSAAV